MLCDLREGVMQGLRMVEQRILAGEQEDVGVGFFDCAQGRLRTIDAKAPGLDQALLAHLGQLRHRALHRLGEPLLPWHAQVFFVLRREIVDIRDVDLRHPQTLQAVFDRAPHTGRAVVIAIVERRRLLPHRLGRRVGRGEQAPDLGRHHVIVSRMVVQMMAGTSLRQAQPVPRRGIEIPHARFPYRCQRLLALGVGGRRKAIADGHATEAETTARPVAFALDARIGRQCARIGFPARGHHAAGRR